MENRSEKGSFFSELAYDIKRTRECDPAARSNIEIFFLYPHMKALRSYRKAHWLWTHGFLFLARWISQRARRKTGIEIHPGATIGRGLFIDHGMGVVIGETTIIGDNCQLFHGVTLGGTGEQKVKRHPTLEDNVYIGAGAKCLGDITLGKDCKVGAQAVVLHDVPAGATAVGIPARMIMKDRK